MRFVNEVMIACTQEWQIAVPHTVIRASTHVPAEHDESIARILNHDMKCSCSGGARCSGNATPKQTVRIGATHPQTPHFATVAADVDPTVHDHPVIGRQV